jgi:hypothetical protein
MSLDRQSAAAAERRRAEWAINAIRPPSTMAPSRTHSQMRLDAELVLDAEPAEGVAGADVVTTAVVGWAGVAVTVVVAVTGTFEVAVTGTVEVAVTGAVGRAVAVLPGRLPTALLTVPPQPATRQPAVRMAAGRERPFAEHRMLDPLRCRRPAAR